MQFLNVRQLSILRFLNYYLRVSLTRKFQKNIWKKIGIVTLSLILFNIHHILFVGQEIHDAGFTKFGVVCIISLHIPSYVVLTKLLNKSHFDKSKDFSPKM